MNDVMFSDDQLRIAAGLVRRSMLTSLPAPKECPRDFSEDFERRIQELLVSARKRSTVYRLVRRAAGGRRKRMKIADDMLFEHAAKARDIWLSTLPVDEDIPEAQTSKAFEKRKHKLLTEQRRTPRTNRILRYMKQTVAAVLVVAFLTFGGLMTVAAYREKVIEIIVNVFHELTDYRFSSGKMGIDEIVLPELSFGQIPEGMDEVQNRVTSNNRRYIVYENGAGLFFELTQRPIGSDGEYISILDTEGSAYAVIMINGSEAYSNEKDGDVSIVWMVDNIVYRLYGNIEMRELKTIAENIEIFVK